MGYIDFNEKIEKVEKECFLELVKLMNTFDLKKVIFDNDSDNMELYPLRLAFYNDYDGISNVTIESVEFRVDSPSTLLDITIKVEGSDYEYTITDFGDNSIIYIYDRVYCELNRTDN